MFRGSGKVFQPGPDRADPAGVGPGTAHHSSEHSTLEVSPHDQYQPESILHRTRQA